MSFVEALIVVQALRLFQGFAKSMHLDPGFLDYIVNKVADQVAQEFTARVEG